MVGHRIPPWGFHVLVVFLGVKQQCWTQVPWNGSRHYATTNFPIKRCMSTRHAFFTELAIQLCSDLEGRTRSTIHPKTLNLEREWEPWCTPRGICQIAAETLEQRRKLLWNCMRFGKEGMVGYRKNRVNLMEHNVSIPNVWLTSCMCISSTNDNKGSNNYSNLLPFSAAWIHGIIYSSSLGYYELTRLILIK